MREYIIKTCERCGNQFKTKSTRGKYCSEQCRTRQAAYISYIRRKDMPGYREQSKARWRAWYEKNPEKFNELMRNCWRRRNGWTEEEIAQNHRDGKIIRLNIGGRK